MQEQVYSVSCKIATDDRFLQNMMRSVDALPARTEANQESINGRSAEFFKKKEFALCTQEAHSSPLVPEQRDLQRNIWKKDPIECHGRQLHDPLVDKELKTLSAVSCLLHTNSWMFSAACKTSEAEQRGLAMRDSGLGDQPPRPPRGHWNR